MPNSQLRHQSAAVRMRLHRQRRKSGLLCLTVEIRETEIAALVRKGMLHPDQRHDARSLRDALYGFLDRHLGGGL